MVVVSVQGTGRENRGLAAILDELVTVQLILLVVQMPPKNVQKPQEPSSKSSKKGLNRKATPKQPIPAAERLRRLFTSLCAQIEGGHFTNAIKTCDKSESAVISAY